MRFNPPPNWPAPPTGWTPPPGWEPDPAWGPSPPGWRVWQDDRPWVVRHKVATGVGGAVLAFVMLGAVGAAISPDSTTPTSAAGVASTTTASTSTLPSNPADTPTTTPSAPASSAASVGLAPVASATSTLNSGDRAISAAQPNTALAVVGSLTVRARAPKTGYDRALFGQAWADADRNGCDTRNDVLRRDLTAYVLKAGTNGCLVLRGTLRDPYTGNRIAFVRGPQSAVVQVDHVVALSDAWQKGAQNWPAAKRQAFANDSLNLLAVSGATNLRKGAGDAATWLPPAKGYRCQYVARQTAVKRKYGLWVTAAERAAAVQVLAGCPSQKLPIAKVFRLGGGTVQAAPLVAKPQPPAPRTTAPAPLASAGTDPDMGTCTAAKAAGFGPYYAGKDAEYDWYRDADSDGIVCE